ncbi:hypothetical protein Bca52824_000666 [Brassica carinata]|uniref:Uncharacterized protein n=1 Tax=Brassica carinata TaxID=52824 RepID=A0A8X7WH82_BRACI|nr:hypothetical protein Bca52824_000666 [Brassica carinata]
MTSSRVFIGEDIQPKIDYCNWLSSNPEIAKRVNADEVTRAETMTIGKIFAYVKQECQGKIQDITVTKIVSPEVLPTVPTPLEILLDAGDEVVVPSANVLGASSKSCGSIADEGNGVIYIV